MKPIARQIKSKTTWDTVVLPSKETELLRQIAAAAAPPQLVRPRQSLDRKSRPRAAVKALFVGGSGTNNTKAAQVIATDLKLDLYRIDLSQVVSKYIGETEKNLRRIFDAAEASGAILLFDEADALFGKRSEVKDSHDRYANTEVSYLLQRIESYPGLVIFATERKAALDPAFIRRLRYTVTFPSPRPTGHRRVKPPAP